ncbi:hypothetical protein G6F35_015112 [Rhizopus arrhizus]|nr:hypothetical protein G6F35_015112 [Rhizopus arrhizus]
MPTSADAPNMNSTRSTRAPSPAGATKGAMRREDAAQRHALMSGLAGVVGHLGQHPRDQHQRQSGHDPERRAPAHRGSQQGAQRHAQGQGDGCAHHGKRHRLALLGRGRIEDQEADDGQQQDVAAPPAAGGDRQRNGRQ